MADRKKEPHGWRRKRLPPSSMAEQLTGLHPHNALSQTILRADAIARITEQAAGQAPLPDPEDLLVMWAEQYYAGAGDFFIWQIGFYVAEDLRLNEKLDRDKP